MKLCVKFQEDNQKIETKFQENKERICASFGSGVVVGSLVRIFQKDLLLSDLGWKESSNTYRYTITSTEHKLKKVFNVILQLMNKTENHYEDVDFTYKIYHSGAVTIVLDKKIDCKIIIEGE